MKKAVNKRAVGLLYGPEEPHLDHLAVVCLLMQIPLIVTEKTLAELAKRYYPTLQLIYEDYETVGRKLVNEFEIVFSCLPKVLIEKIVGIAEEFLQKRIHSIWCPHGQSDKGEGSPIISEMSAEEIALVYGERMWQWAKDREPFKHLKALIVTGNYRATFYNREKAFYSQMLSQLIKRNTGIKTILYAPTWEESDSRSSFFSATAHLVKHLPEDYQLIIKPHPYLFESPQTEALIEEYQDHPRVQFLKEFPPIYPLLDACDIYIGDHSSVGYDWLTFNKPMFFLKGSRTKPYLSRCGVVVSDDQVTEIYRLMQFHLSHDKEDFGAIRQEVYRATFGEEKGWDALRLEIIRSYNTLEDPLI